MTDTLELFSGAGGMALGLEKAGYTCAGLLEFEPNACNTLRANFSSPVYEGDARKFDFSRVTSPIEVVAGGPPCQPFSLGGKAKGNQDERDMFPHAIRAINELRPKVFIFENVKGLLRQSFASYLEYILLRLTFPSVQKNKGEEWFRHLSRLEKMKSSGSVKEEYRVVFRLLNAADYGVPQKRERVFIVGIREDTTIEWSFPDPTHSNDALAYQKYVTKQYWDEQRVSPSGEELQAILDNNIGRKLHAKYGSFAPELQPWRTVRQALEGLPNPMDDVRSQVTGHSFKCGAKSYPGHTGSPYDEPSKALKAGVHGVPGGENTLRFSDGTVRYFTVREAARIQTFPDEFSFSGAWSQNMRQLGNAVPVELAKVVSSSILPVIASA